MVRTLQGSGLDKGNRQRERIVGFVAAYHEEWGYPPTMREIQTGLGLSSTSTVQYHVQALKDAGRVVYLPGRKRTIRVIQREEAHDSTHE